MSLENRTVGLVEDDPIMGESLLQGLSLQGADVQWWQTAGAAIHAMSRKRPDVVVCDIRLPDASGETVFHQVADQDAPPPFLFMTGFGDIDQAVRLLRAGAGDYLTKPFDMGDFLKRIDLLMGAALFSESTVLGVSEATRQLERMLVRLARVSSNVLITGETGAGKEVSARFLHSRSSHASGPFIAVNCAAIPQDLMESELFGHEKGAFTGASSRHLGYAERAAGGTLFLDEIGELTPRLQSKLLRLIEDRSFTRVGGEQAIPFRARLVSATNADLDKAVRLGTFRQDLLYRIHVVGVVVPPLRERPDDLVWLADRFFVEFSALQGSELAGLSQLAIDAIHSHPWPGNARELRNRIERAVALSLGPWIMPGDLFPERYPPAGFGEAGDHGLQPLDAARDDAERRHILKALHRTKGAIQPAARLLDVSRTTLWEKMRRYGISAAGE
ncbi:MAG: sigma-54 dependent transcriptional regulator [Ancalomicrobiaceae bacterium]|nr:sigma-54 dependent transcriptional regulator [Ancalomicrobiaceae bacterium]